MPAGRDRRRPDRPKKRKIPRLIDDGASAVQREAIAEIARAFAGVDREGGVSWSETIALDAYEGPEACARARASDLDRGWEDVANDPDWDLSGHGGWAFLDPIGTRYYLPAALVRLVRDPAANENALESLRFTLERDGRDLALLDAKQRCAVARAIRFLAESETIGNAGDRERYHPWQDLYEARWRAFDPDPLPPSESRPDSAF